MTPTPPTWLLPFALLRVAAGRAMRADLLSAYGASLAKVLSWAVVAGMVYRVLGSSAFAAFALARTVVTIVNYASLGLAPAVIVLFPQFSVRQTRASETTDDSGVLGYARVPNNKIPTPPTVHLFRTAMWLSVLLLCVCVLLVPVLAALIDHLNDGGERFWDHFTTFAGAFFIGGALRSCGDVAGARMQAEGRITFDNVLQILGELLWPLIVLITWTRFSLIYFEVEPFGVGSRDAIAGVGIAWVITGGLLAVSRWLAARSRDGQLQRSLPKDGYSWLLLSTGGVILASQFADLLYAPANLWLIKHFLTPEHLATYAPTLHIDAALLLLVGGLSAVLLPKAAIAFAASDRAAVRRYFIQGTIGSFIVLAIAATVACLVSDWLFRLWFDDPLPATQAILPLVMIHTVVGGASSIGRSILLGIGRVRAYATAALIGGVANVVLAIVLLTQTNLGLKGIIYATIATVTIRSVIWMPWYTLCALRSDSAAPASPA